MFFYGTISQGPVRMIFDHPPPHYFLKHFDVAAKNASDSVILAVKWEKRGKGSLQEVGSVSIGRCTGRKTE
jgi:hypothetical protein